MNQGEKPDLIVAHGPDCLDGMGAVWALHQKWPDIPVVWGVYGQRLETDPTGLRVLIVDFSYPEEHLREIAAAAHSLTVLDHHASSEKAVKTLLNEALISGEHRQDRSGAVMAWEYAWGSPVAPKIIAHIQDRDLWKWEMPWTKEVTALLGANQDSDWEAEWSKIGRALESGRTHEVYPLGEAIIRARDVDMAKILRTGCREMIIGGHRVPVCNAPFFWSSEIAHAMASERGEGFAATYMDMPDGRKFSLRSADGEKWPVHEIAKEYGGGGHKAAAGFTVPIGWEGDVDDTEPTEAQLQTIQMQNRGGVTVVEG